MGNIGWTPIAEIPAALKDGRELLLWDDKRRVADCHFGFYAGGMYAGGKGHDYWLMRGSSQKLEPTHFAEINPPT